MTSDITLISTDKYVLFDNHRYRISLVGDKDFKPHPNANHTKIQELVQSILTIEQDHPDHFQNPTRITGKGLYFKDIQSPIVYSSPRQTQAWERITRIVAGIDEHDSDDGSPPTPRPLLPQPTSPTPSDPEDDDRSTSGSSTSSRSSSPTPSNLETDDEEEAVEFGRTQKRPAWKRFFGIKTGRASDTEKARLQKEVEQMSRIQAALNDTSTDLLNANELQLLAKLLKERSGHPFMKMINKDWSHQRELRNKIGFIFNGGSQELNTAEQRALIGAIHEHDKLLAKLEHPKPVYQFEGILEQQIGARNQKIEARNQQIKDKP